jgi:hypothetical protein
LSSNFDNYYLVGGLVQNGSTKVKKRENGALTIQLSTSQRLKKTGNRYYNKQRTETGVTRTDVFEFCPAPLETAVEW